MNNKNKLTAPSLSDKDVEGVAEKYNGYSVYAKGSEKYNAFNEGFVEGLKYAKAAQSSAHPNYCSKCHNSYFSHESLKRHICHPQKEAAQPQQPNREDLSYADVFNSNRNYTEDYKLENGNYENTCIKCKLPFIGYKRRVYCKQCNVPKRELKEGEQPKEFIYRHANTHTPISMEEYNKLSGSTEQGMYELIPSPTK